MYFIGVSLKIHTGKTKVMIVRSSSVELIRLGQEAIEDVDSFTYLGSIIDTKGGVTADFKACIQYRRTGKWPVKISLACRYPNS